MLALIGLPYTFVTATFYDDYNNPSRDPDLGDITLPEIQVLLLSTSVMYFILGSSLEYIRKVELKIIIPVIVVYGFIKIFVFLLYFILL